MQHDDAFSCQGAVKDACDAITTFNPKLEKPVTESTGMRFSEIAAVYLHAFNKMLVSGTHTQWKLVDLQPDLFTVVFDSVVHELKHNKMVMFVQCVDSSIPVYFSAQQNYAKMRAAIDEKLANQFFYPIFDRFLLIFESFFEFIKFIIKLKVFCLNTSFCNQICGINGFLIINVIFVNELSIFSSDYCCSMLAYISEVSSDTRTIYFQFTFVIFDGHLVVRDPVTTFDENFINHTEICPFHSALGLCPHLKDIIDHADFLGYAKKAPYKTGAGIGTPELHTAIFDAPASFLSSTFTHARIMVGWAGEPKGSPVSVCAGSSNPVQSATSELGTSGGGSYPLHTEAAIMATIPTLTQPEIAIVDGQVVTSSLAVADFFSKRHDDVLKKIRILDCSPEFCARNFAETSILVHQPNGGTRKLPCYHITRDGFAFLAMGFTGKRAARFKEAYINAFNQMEKNLSGADAVDMSAVARNARGVYLHLREIHQIWKSQLYPMLKAVESPLASKLYDRVGDAVFGAALVDSRLNGSDKEAHP